MSFLFSDYSTNQFGDYQYTDNTPDDFNFISVTDAELSTEYESNIETITGMAPGTDISVTAGEYRLDGGSWETFPGFINPGQTLQLRNTSSASETDTVVMSVTVGTLTKQWSITTGSISETIYSTSDRIVVY